MEQNQNRIVNYMVFFELAIVLFLLDQLSKYYIVKQIKEFTEHEVIKSILYITHVKNTGAAWGIFAGQQFFFLIVTFVAVFVILYYVYQFQYNTFIVCALASIFAGTLGNFYDRIRYGEVTDFIHVYIFDYSFPVFNVADMCLTIGVLLLIVYMFFFDSDMPKIKIESENTDEIPLHSVLSYEEKNEKIVKNTVDTESFVQKELRLKINSEAKSWDDIKEIGSINDIALKNEIEHTVITDEVMKKHVGTLLTKENKEIDHFLNSISGNLDTNKVPDAVQQEESNIQKQNKVEESVQSFKELETKKEIKNIDIDSKIDAFLAEKSEEINISLDSKYPNTKDYFRNKKRKKEKDTLEELYVVEDIE